MGALRACLKIRKGAVFSPRVDGEARRRRISLVDLRLRSNEASRPVARKPSGRQVFCLWPALAQSLQPAAGMRGPRRLGHIQIPRRSTLLVFRQALSALSEVFSTWNFLI